MENTADRTVRQEPDGKKNRTLQEHAGVGPPAIPAIAVLREPLKIHINDHDAEFTQPAEEKAKEISIKLTPMVDVTSGWIWGVPRFEQALFSLNWVGVQSPYRLAERQKIRRRLRGLPPVAKMEG